ncbi:MAG: alpha-D-ribose 1-methylphosphonate 5-triphosphate diphosphatase [Marinibacterium sp.]|nr:alpha-D-ribose 1-methylphosphonate 5-triphosphate diphosphatase [Marinibacterium sp.]
MTDFTITGARVILGDDIIDTPVAVSQGRIASIGAPVSGTQIDGRGLILAPALIDLHGDAFERQIMPRPNVFFPTDAALLETDRQLAANGIATAYHALTLSWEPGLRSVTRGTDIIDTLARLGPRLTVENRVQLRWETFCFEAEPLITRALRAGLTPSLAFNDHTSMAMLDSAVRLQDRPFEFAPDFPVTDTSGSRFVQIMESRAKRSGLSPRAFADLILQIWDRRAEVPQAIARMAAVARDAGAPMLSHDDSQHETRDFYRGHGARTAEFPMQVAVAETARARGDHIVFGAPNALRGGSHIGSPGAADMVEAGLCDALASDYYYPAMLAAVARLDAERRAPRAALWQLVSTGPARAMGLTDRGIIAAGLRADLVLIDWPDNGPPAVRRTFVAGRTAYRAEPATA